MERKVFKFEVKAIDEETGIIEGYASTFDPTPDSYGDVVDPGAFTKTIKENANSIVSLFNHNPNEPIGLPELQQDKKGLFARIKIVRGVQKAEEVLLLAKAGVIKHMSIGYDTIKQEMDKGLRHLKEVKLYDVSPVVFAANTNAVITGIKATEFKPYPNEHACRLRDPNDFQDGTFKRMTRRSDGKVYSVIMGRLEGEDTLTEQAYRYDKEIWDADEARSHCKDHDGTFEAAQKIEEHIIAEAKETVKILQALLEKSEGKQEPAKSTPAPEDTKEAADMESVLSGIGAELDGFDTKAAEARIDELVNRFMEVK